MICCACTYKCGFRKILLSKWKEIVILKWHEYSQVGRTKSCNKKFIHQTTQRGQVINYFKTYKQQIIKVNLFDIFCLLCWKRMSPFSAPDSFSSFHSLPAGLFCWLIFESKCAQQILNCWLTFEQIMFSNWAIPPKSLPGHQGGRQSVTMCRRQRFIRATITTLEEANAGGKKVRMWFMKS